MSKLGTGLTVAGGHAAWVTGLLVILIPFAVAAITTPQEQASASRQERVQELLKTIRDKDIQQKEPNHFREAIQELGRLRSTEAVDDLIKLLTYRGLRYREEEPYSYMTSGSSRSSYDDLEFPARTALEEIGRPALPALVKVIESNDEASVISKNARYAVRSIFDRHPPGDAKAFFKEQAAHAPTPEAARRLLKALETADQDWRLD